MMSFSLAVSKKERMINIIHEFILIRGNLYLKSVYILISRTEGTELNLDNMKLVTQSMMQKICRKIIK